MVHTQKTEKPEKAKTLTAEPSSHDKKTSIPKKSSAAAVKVKKTPKKIRQRSQRFISLTQMIDKNKLYSIEEAIELAKKTATTKFDGSIEVHMRLGIDTKKGEQQVRGAVSLPHGTGKTKIVAAFVPDGKEDEAKKAGADIAGSTELINSIKQTGKIAFEVAVATPDMMPKLAVIAKILGPKGLMPSPKNETITTNLGKTIGELKRGKVNFKNDDTGNIHAMIGKASFDSKNLVENFNALYFAIKRAKPASSKGIFIQSITLHTTMGPGIRINPT